MDNIDWSLIPSFLAVVKSGSLSGAARELRISQPTLGRHIRSLELSAGTDLFYRKARGLELTDAGTALLPSALEMERAAANLRLASVGQDIGLSGTVRITASQIVSHYLLPPILNEFRQSEPDIQLELAASDSSENLLFREADIAIRMYRPTQLDIVAKQIGELGLGLFASKSYVRRKGMPETFAELAQHDLVGYDRDERLIEGLRAYGMHVSREDFPMRCDDQAVYWELVLAGCGIGAGQTNVAKKFPDIVPILPDIPIPGLPVWLAAPDALHRTPRIRRVWDHLNHALSALVS